MDQSLNDKTAKAVLAVSDLWPTCLLLGLLCHNMLCRLSFAL